MVAGAVAARGIDDLRVLEAMAQVPRHLFVPHALESFAYADGPLSIGDGQTISQAATVAVMCQALKLSKSDRVLEIGAGSGYSAAVLSLLANQVHTVERHQRLAMAATYRLSELEYSNADVHWADGREGWAKAGPYDAIVVSAGSSEIPQALIAQLAKGGRLVMPVGDRFSQTLIRLTHTSRGLRRESLSSVRFAPLVSGVTESLERNEVAAAA